MTIAVTYDVKQNHTELKKNLFDRGFYNCIKMTSGPNKALPNTTVWYDGNDVDMVQRQFDAAVAATIPNPGVEKVLYIPFSGSCRLISNQDC